MKHIRAIIFLTAMLCLMAIFSQCSSAQKLEQKAPMAFGDVYYQKHTQAVQDLKSMITLYIPIKEESNNIELDSVYFRGRSAKLSLATNNKQSLYFARFITKPAYTEDLILSSDMKEEQQNKLPIEKTNIPFELLPNECVISYKQAGSTRHYKISNIKERRLKNVTM